MDYCCRPLHDDDLDQIVSLSLVAWEPVFVSFENVLGTAIFTRIYPDWRVDQAKAVEDVCRAPEHTVWVAERDGAIAGFIAYSLDTTKLTGEIVMLAVDPAHQNRGVGAALNELALNKMREAGMTLAVVNTGGDPGHAPARRSYEKAGFTGLPLVHYCQVL